MNSAYHRSPAAVDRQRCQYTPEDAIAAHGTPNYRYIGNVVYGGLDGIITTFAVVSGVAGAQLGAGVVLILGVANLLADGISMATGAYLSNRSEREYYERERQREQWQITQYPAVEQQVLRNIYANAGYETADIERLIEIQARDPERWATTMLIEELGLLADERKPWGIALSTFAAFVIAGVIPLLGYIVGLFTPIAPTMALLTSLILSALALFGLGAAKVWVTERNPWRSGLHMLLVGGLAASVAYGVGVLFQGIGQR
ncbi:MAG TPA: VIT1/CCC1 transporter family protein [Herpetosiphonaceae bacterium]